MVTVIVVLNVLISLLCLYAAWKVWNLRRVLAAAADAVTLAERNTYALLHGAPKNISQGQLGVHGLRERYQQLEQQLRKVQQVLTLLVLVQRILPSALRVVSVQPDSRGRYANGDENRAAAPEHLEELSPLRHGHGIRTSRSRSRRSGRPQRYRKRR
jgi:hypothetical protein